MRRAGHTPFIPHMNLLANLITPHGEAIWLDEVLKFVPRCDAVLRLPGESRGADKEVSLANEMGIPVYYNVSDIGV